jgi:hypothetical protein
VRAITDSEGKVAINLRRGDLALSFKVAGIDDVLFAPGAEVEIPDERLNAVIAALAAPFDLEPEDVVWA